MEKGKRSIVKVRLEGTQENIAIVADQLQRDFWVLDRSRAYPNRNNKDVYRVYMVVYPRLPEVPVLMGTGGEEALCSE